MSGVNINDNERRVLRALHAIWDGYDGFCYQSFKPLCRRTRMSRSDVRRACRSLTRKGLAQYGRGLWTEDGEVAGSGYACTKAGAALLHLRSPKGSLCNCGATL